MPSLLLPLALLFLSLGGRASTSTQPPPAAPKPKPKPKPGQPAAAIKAAAPAMRQKLFKRDQKASAAVKPQTEEQAREQAAVNAAVANMVNELSTSKAQAQAAVQQPAKPVVSIDVPPRNARDAAAYLRDFLKRTRKYGSKKSPVQEVKDAQRDMGGLSIDGIVGPKTRGRAKQLGTTLP